MPIPIKPSKPRARDYPGTLEELLGNVQEDYQKKIISFSQLHSSLLFLETLKVDVYTQDIGPDVSLSDFDSIESPYVKSLFADFKKKSGKYSTSSAYSSSRTSKVVCL